MRHGKSWCKCEKIDVTVAYSGGRLVDRVNNHHSLKRLKKIVPFLPDVSLCSAFINSDLIWIYSIKVWLLSHIYMKYLFQSLVIGEGHYILMRLMWDILRVTCPMKANASHRMLFCVSHIRSSSTLKVISSYYTTLLSNHFGSICKYIPLFILVTRRQMREMGEGNKFCWQTSSFYFDLPRDKQFLLGNFWEAALLLQSWRISMLHKKIYGPFFMDGVQLPQG